MRHGLPLGLALAAVLGLLAAVSLRPIAISAAGPPYPPPVAGQRVYDQVGALRPETISQAERTIQAIEARTGVQVVVYTQVKPESDTPALAEQDAKALMDQWGIGRRGFDDGLVILYDLQDNLVHGQVQLYAGSGFRARFLSDADRQRIFEQDMVPLLSNGDLDGATLAALAQVDQAATPEHAAALERGRQLDAVLGFGGVILAVLLVLFYVYHWLRFGRDPVYLDDSSILMPAPPPDLVPASGALLLDGRSGGRELTTALVDLAARGLVTFRAEDALLKKRAGIQVLPDPSTTPDAVRARRRPLGSAGSLILQKLSSLAEPHDDGYIPPDDLHELASGIPDFHSALEKDAVARGWFGRQPRTVITRWAIAGGVEIVAGLLIGIAGANLPSGGLVLAAGALVVAGVVTAVGAFAMPARTMSGAMLRAMLAAYRRTLQLTLQQARSMGQVVESHALPWLETPDEAVAWSVAFGLDHEVEVVMERTLADLKAGGSDPSHVWLPAWYLTSTGHGLFGTSSGGGGGGLAPGVLAGSAIPNFGGMVAAIGSIGSSASSSGGGGGFGGGGGGGGGGAGGGF